jgi:TPP-dependent indolepyruvate ferredoxin oxidoreductase alpha subunit
MVFFSVITVFAEARIRTVAVAETQSTTRYSTQFGLRTQGVGVNVSLDPMMELDYIGLT